MPVVSSYQQGAFTTPVNGASADASVVLGNDNNLRLKFNAHDADATIHVQSSVLASRPAAGTPGRFWVTSDGLRAYLDSGSAWGELAYLPYVAGATSSVATLNTTTGAVSDNTQIIYQRGGANKWRAGTNIGGTNADRYEIYNESAAAVVLAIANTTGAVTVTGAFSANSVIASAITANGLMQCNNGFTFGAGTFTLATMGGGTGIVSVGAVDSGGAGFRLLRVPN